MLLEDFLLVNKLRLMGFKKMFVNFVDDRYAGFITHKTNHAGPLPAKENVGNNPWFYNEEEMQQILAEENLPNEILESCLFNFCNWFDNLMNQTPEDMTLMESVLSFFGSQPENDDFMEVSVFESIQQYSLMVNKKPEQFSAHLLVNSDEGFVYDTQSFHFDTLWVLETDIVREAGSLANMGLDSYSIQIPARHMFLGKLNERERPVGILTRFIFKNGQRVEKELFVSAYDTVSDLKFMFWVGFKKMGLPVPYAQMLFLSDVEGELDNDKTLMDYGVLDKEYFHEATMIVKMYDMEGRKFSIYQCHPAIPGMGNIVEVRQIYFHPLTIEETDDSPHMSYLLNYNTTLLPHDREVFSELEGFMEDINDEMDQITVPDTAPVFKSRRLTDFINSSMSKAGLHKKFQSSLEELEHENVEMSRHPSIAVSSDPTPVAQRSDDNHSLSSSSSLSTVLEVPGIVVMSELDELEETK
eukprot:TRINITY_DN617_c0_g1_i13.p1 TRINITY_DN617_c0_g1~~TRINITY_DN617_c0_g1_i13.p1  ORF type:complete len:470 (+),score=181.40 TRINITY_DN617_c0_g1_i13:1811-3220(+)